MGILCGLQLDLRYEEGTSLRKSFSCSFLSSQDSTEAVVEEPVTARSRLKSFFKKQPKGEENQNDYTFVRNGSISNIEDNSITLKTFKPIKEDTKDIPSTSRQISPIPEFRTPVTPLDLNRLHMRLEGIELRLGDMEEKMSRNMKEVLELLKGRSLQDIDVIADVESS